MNYLAHYLAARTQSHESEFLLGSVLPDMLSAWNRSFRFVRSAIDEKLRTSQEPLWRGIHHHLQADLRFHRSIFFKDSDRRLFEQMVLRIKGKTDVRLFFLSHVSVEFLLDYILLENEPQAAIQFYHHLGASHIDTVAETLGLFFESDPQPLANHLYRFMEARFVETYRTFDGLLSGLNGMLRRTRQSPLRVEAGEMWKHLLAEEMVILKRSFPDWKNEFLG